jgi:signal transduction histidine kinase
MDEDQPRVLVVDDHEPARYARARRLREAGYEVTEAATGREALATVADTVPDLVVLDVDLPDMHGFEACRAIKGRPATAHVPVLEVSAVFVSRDDRVAGLRSGADWYLVEPVDDDELVATCRTLVRAGQAEQKLRRVLAEGIARAQIERGLITRARQQAAMAELGRRALAEDDLSSVMDAAVDVVARTLDVEYAKILELLPDGDALLLRAGTGWEEGLVGKATVGAGLDSQAGYTLTSGAPVVVEDLSRETRFTPAPLLVHHGVMSGMSVVIFGPGRPWGVLGVHTSSPRRFSPDDTHFLQATATTLAEAIRRADVEGALRAARDEERRLRQRLEAHSRAAVDAQEGERRRIARELHDEIGQTLTGLKLTLEHPERLPAEAVADRLGRARALVGELLHRVQDLSLDLRPAMLDDLGLRPALLWLVERYAAQTGVEVALECTGLDGRLRPEVETAAYRIVQEGLTNVARHAGVSMARVLCAPSGHSLLVEVRDEGVGFEVEAVRPEQSSGLAGMEERARATGGQFRLQSEPGAGTVVVAALPLGERRREDP